MQIRNVVVSGVAVNMVDNLPFLGARNLAMLPLAPIPLGPVAEALSGCRCLVWCVGLLNRWVRLRFCGSEFRNGANGSIPAATYRNPMRQSALLFIIRKKRVSVPMPHLVVPHTHTPSNRRPIAMDARSADHLPAPSVLGRPVPLYALVVHQAKAVCSVFAPAPVNRAFSVCFVGAHDFLAHLFPKLYTEDKALGNSMACNVMSWIGSRIQEVGNG
jgi:hypothetical protein